MNQCLPTYMVKSGKNLAVVGSLKEVYKFLQELQTRGITEATLVGSGQSFRLNEQGHWMWVQS